jgi:glycosyltransferase involved in cell wall biosynthesis
VDQVSLQSRKQPNFALESAGCSPSWSQFAGARHSRTCNWTVLLPFHNEESFLKSILDVIAAQTELLELILIDNGSTDASCTIANDECRRLGIRYILVHEPRRGKVHALSAGLSLVQTPFVATMDADTSYPPDYLAQAQRILRFRCRVAAQAFYVRPQWKRWRRIVKATKLQLLTFFLPHQSHTGGAGQVFRSSALREAGGFDPARWALPLEDHEIVHRVSRFGRVGADFRFWCSPARREKDFARLRWTLSERITYHLMTPRLQVWFFYGFLGPRLRARANPTPKTPSMDS